MEEPLLGKIEEREGNLFDAPDGAALIRMFAQSEVLEKQTLSY